jgi:CRP/FNR family cyclic AMP-dependent transcriptional regulator
VTKKTTDIAPLDRLGWLARQPQSLRDWVASVGVWRDYAAGQVVYMAHDPADGLYGLARGALDVSSPDAGEEQVALSRAEPGFWIGDAALLANAPRLVTVTAMTEARLLFVNGPAVLRLLRDRPEMWHCFYMLSNINLATALELLAEAMSCPPRIRIARRILRLSVGDQTKVMASQADIARLAGVTRATMQRGLRDLVSDGAIETGYRSIRVKNRDALSRAARLAR